MSISAKQVRALVGPLPLVAPDELWESVYAAYAKTPRCYHTFDHIVDVARNYRLVEQEIGWIQPAEVGLATLYHDAVYRVGSRTNEHDSAELARAEIARWLGETDIDVNRVAELIELTARHGTLGARNVDTDAALFLDCDMAILGAPAAEYDRYASQVAAEYAPVIPARVYSAGRAKFLDMLLGARHIFLSQLFQDRFAAAARVNVARELQTIHAG